MSRRPAFTQRKIKDREKFGFGPVEYGKIEQPSTCPWNFDVAIEILTDQRDNIITGVEMYARRNGRTPNKIAKLRASMHARVRGEIDALCRKYWLDYAVERQEADAAKAEAFQRAPRWHKRRQRELARLRKARESNDRSLARDALAKLDAIPWIPPSLEQEAARRAGGLPTVESFKVLKERYAGASKAGSIGRSVAQSHVVQGLQELAARYAPSLARKRGGAPPTDLTQFICEVLDTAGIKYPDPEGSPTRFRRLLIHPHPGQPDGTRKCSNSAMHRR
jgi:hypothetical protein